MPKPKRLAPWDTVSSALERWFYTSPFVHGRSNLPHSSIFFSSRLEYLRHLSHQAHVFAQHRRTRPLQLELVEDRISQVVLQMCLYYRSMSHSDTTRRLLGESLGAWKNLVKLGDALENDTFGSFGFEQNCRFLHEQLDSRGAIWKRAAEWAIPDVPERQKSFVVALEEMVRWLVSRLTQMRQDKVSTLVVSFKLRKNELIVRDHSRIPTESGD